MKLKKSIDETSLLEVEKLYNEAFPEIERMPFKMIKEQQEKGKIDILSIEENETFSGIAIMAYNDDLVLLNYFAIDSKKRGNGIGGKALDLLKEYYKNKRLFLEIEDVNTPSKNKEQRKKRKNFYLSHGMKLQSFTVNYFNVNMEILSADKDINFDEYVTLYKSIFGEYVNNKIFLIK